MKNRLIFALAVVGMITTDACAQENLDARFSINSAVVQGSGDAPPQATVMLDRLTGQTWFLGIFEGRTTWFPIVYATKIPPNVLPPLGSRTSN